MPGAITLVECPRDAMQGWKTFIPTAEKAAYLNDLLKVGFDVLDFGSFVSPKAIPQLADTRDVIPMLRPEGTGTRLLAIVANARGAEEAVNYDEISSLGFPFSISETFQKRNTNKTIEASVKEVEVINGLCSRKGKELVVYISMGFGNPYGDPYTAEAAIGWVRKLADAGVGTIAMADTVGVADPETIRYIYSHLVPEFPSLRIGAHFHTAPGSWEEKLEAAWAEGCTRFDSALKGIGGCPMAEDELVGNMATENLIAWCTQKGIDPGIDRDAFTEAMNRASRIFI